MMPENNNSSRSPDTPPFLHRVEPAWNPGVVNGWTINESPEAAATARLQESPAFPKIPVDTDTPTGYQYRLTMFEHGPVLEKAQEDSTYAPIITGSRPAPDGSNLNPRWGETFDDIVSALRWAGLCAPPARHSNPDKENPKP